MTKYLLIQLLFAITLLSCKNTTPEPTPPAADNRQNIVNTYATIGYAMYADAVAEAQKLQNVVDAFTNAPSANGLEACKAAWKAARVPYSQVEAFRFYGGPIDGENGKEAYLNAWPLDEAAMDYVVGIDVAGVINNKATFPQITEEVLFTNNQLASEVSVVTGYHAIEFLLWGQDLSTTGPGSRPYTDYLDNGTAKNQDRRRLYLKAVTSLLVKHLQEIEDAWKPNTSNYRSTFTAAANMKSSLAKIIVGLGRFTKGEMSGERISVALQDSSQEDEHDCFSDYTLEDIKLWQKGLKAIYYGSYINAAGTVVSGFSLNDFALANNKILANKIDAKFAASDAELSKLTLPFDVAIFTEPDRSIIDRFIINLRAQADSYTDLLAPLAVLKEYNSLNTEQ